LEKSDWNVMPQTFPTPCPDAFSSINENFDVYATGVGVIPICWTKNTTHATQPNIVAVDAGNGLNTKSLTFRTSKPQFVALPKISAELRRLQLDFKISKENSSSGPFQVGYMSDPTDASTFVPVKTYNDATIKTLLQKRIAFIGTEETSQDLRIAFRYGDAEGITTSTGWYYWVDDVVVTAVACTAPYSLQVNDVETTSALVSWSSIETGWVFEYKTAEAAEWTSITIEAGGSPEVALSDLVASTQYQVRVKSVCGEDNESVWSEVFSFSTECGDIAPFYRESFENTLSDLTCWTLANSNPAAGVKDWTIVTAATAQTNPACTPQHGSRMLRYNSNNTAAGSWALAGSKAIDISEPLHLSFWIYRNDGYASATYNSEGIDVYYNATPDDSGEPVHLGFTQRSNATNEWYYVSYKIPAVEGGQTHLVFKGTSAHGHNIFLDNIVLDYLLPIVETAAADEVSSKAATLNSTVTQRGGTVTGTGYKYRVKDEVNPDADWTLSLAAEVAGLTPETEYEFKAFAAVDSDTAWGEVLTFTTLRYLPLVTTTAATSVASSTATLNKVVEAGDGTVTGTGYKYRVKEEENPDADWTLSLIDGVTGLTPETEYEFKAFAAVNLDTVWGEVLTFTTLRYLPDVETLEATDVDDASATLNSNVTENDGNITSQGYNYRAVTEENDGEWLESLDGALTGLTPVTEYEFKAFAAVNLDTVWGEVLTFTTLQIVPVADFTFSVSGFRVTFAGTSTGEPTGWLWNFGAGGATSTEQNPEHSYAEAGEYTVTLVSTNARGSSALVSKKVNVISSGIEDVLAGKVTLYPNPAKQTVTLATSGLNAAATVIITDIAGKEMETYNLGATETELNINVSNFADGTYLVKIVSDNAKTVKRLVVKK
jgi:PKD repeat protein